MKEKGIGQYLWWNFSSKKSKTKRLLEVASGLRKWGQTDRQMISDLLAAGADVNARDGIGNSALDYARKVDNRLVEDILLEHVAREREPKHTVSKRGFEPKPKRPAAESIKPESVNVASDGSASWPPELVEKLTTFPVGFMEETDEATFYELGISNLFAVQCAVQIALNDLARNERTDELLKAIGARFGTGLAEPAALQAAANLPKYCEEHDNLRKKGVEPTEALMTAIATTFERNLDRIGIPQDNALQFTALAIQACTDAVKITITVLQEHFQNAPQTAASPNPEPEQTSQTDWLSEKLQDSNASDTDRVELMLRHAAGAREFLRLATQNGFSVQSEDNFGLRLAGPSSELIFTVLASRGEDEIFTLSIKEGNEPVQTLVDEGRLRPRVCKKKPSSAKIALS